MSHDFTESVSRQSLRARGARSSNGTVKPSSLRVLIVEDIDLDRGSRVVLRSGKKMELTAVEFDLLAMFLTSAGRVVEREEIARRVLGRNLAPLDRSMDTHVCNLRKKLGPRTDGLERIKVVRGLGYVYTFSRRRTNNNSVPLDH